MGNSIIIDLRASINLDFLISMLLLLMITSSILSVAEGRFLMAEKIQKQADARLISEKVAQKIEVVYSGGEGHEIRMEMPSSLKGSYYTVKVNQTGVTVMVDGKRGYSFSYHKKISRSNNFQSTVYMYPKKTYIIRNVKVKNNSNKVVIFEDK